MIFRQYLLHKLIILYPNIYLLIFFKKSSPGVTITELQKRGGLNDEAYAKVSTEYARKL